MTAKTNTPLSERKIKSCLSISVIVLVLLYSYVARRIVHHHAAGVQLESGIGIGASVPLNVPSQLPTTQECALTLLHFYISAFLLWNTVLFWSKRRRRLIMYINAFLLVISSILFRFMKYCNCTSGEYTNIATRPDENFDLIYSTKEIPLDDNIRISFRLHDPNDIHVPDKFSGVPGYRCFDKADLPPSLSKRTILNFTTTIATDLKIAFMGDSITEQFAQAFDAAVLGNGHESNRLAQTYRNGLNAINLHNCLSIAAPIRGGGVSAFWRIANLLSTKTRASEYICEHKWTMWNEKQPLIMIQHQYADDGELSHRRFHSSHESSGLICSRKRNHHLCWEPEPNQNSVGSFDAVVMRIPHGWLKLDEITQERIIEAINLSNEHLGAQTVIISTLPLNNNVATSSDWEGIAKINQMVRDIARDWVQPKPGKVRYVLVQEWGNFTNQILWMNAKHIQMTNSSKPDFSQSKWELPCADFLLKRLSAESFWNPSISMVCAERTFSAVNKKNQEVEDCIRNKISRDGVHWCVESLGPRYSASIACLLGCVHNGDAPTSQDNSMVRQCEQKCNDQFMSIVPVAKEWIGSRMALFSRWFG